MHKRTNKQWLDDLQADGVPHESALSDLRQVVLGGLPYALNKWLPTNDPRFASLAELVPVHPPHVIQCWFFRHRRRAPYSQHARGFIHFDDGSSYSHVRRRLQGDNADPAGDIDNTLARLPNSMFE